MVLLAVDILQVNTIYICAYISYHVISYASERIDSADEILSSKDRKLFAVQSRFSFYNCRVTSKSVLKFIFEADIRERL